MKPRIWTPDQVFVEYQNGREVRMVREAPKRGCTGCGTVLGDLSDAETAAAGRGRRLRPSADECPLCLGFHAVLAKPGTLEPGQTEPDITATLLCPGTPKGAAVADCADYARCDCKAPAGTEIPSSEWVAFLAARCPGSPTGEHRHLPERELAEVPFVGAPQPGSCAYQNAHAALLATNAPTDYIWNVFGGTPGLYPVEAEIVGTDQIVFEPVEIHAGRRAEAIPV